MRSISSKTFCSGQFRSVAELVRVWSVLVCLALMPSSGCGPASGGVKDNADQRPTIVCTSGQVGDMLTHLVGDHYRIITLMGPGVDPHLYRPTPADMSEFNKAAMIFYNGLHLEGKLSEVLENLATKKPTFAVT